MMKKYFQLPCSLKTRLIWTPHYINQKAFFSDLVVVVLFSHFKNNPVLSKLVILNSLLSQTVCCFPRPYFNLSLISISCLWFLFMCVLSQLFSYLSVNYVRTGRTQKLAIRLLCCTALSFKRTLISIGDLHSKFSSCLQSSLGNLCKC